MKSGNPRFRRADGDVLACGCGIESGEAIPAPAPVEINQARNTAATDGAENRGRVDRQRGIFERNLTPRPAHVEEGLREPVQEAGSGGHLLLYPTQDCWALVDDIRNPPLEL